MNALTIYSYLGVDCSLSIASFQIEISFFFPLHAIRERYPRHQEKYQPREEFQKLIKSKQNSVEVF